MGIGTSHLSNKQRNRVTMGIGTSHLSNKQRNRVTMGIGTSHLSNKLKWNILFYNTVSLRLRNGVLILFFTLST